VIACVLPAALISLVVQTGMMVVYIDLTLSGASSFMESIYTPEELYRVRNGRGLSLAWRMGLLVGGLGVVPMLITLFCYMHDSLGNHQDAMITMAEYSMLGMVMGVVSIVRGIQRPLNKLIVHMDEVALGNYAVKSRVYFSDEIGHLKAGFNNMLDGLREREAMRDMFGKYMSGEIARELLQPGRVDLGGVETEAAVLFCDIRDFTPRSEKMSPHEVVAFLNRYFQAVTPHIAANHGVINKFIGDAVMAVFTPLLGSAEYAADAITAAVDMRAALAEHNAKLPPEERLHFGIGIHVGKLVAGNVGTKTRREYTFIGDTVNIASRIESKTKEFATDLLVSRDALDNAGGKVTSLARFTSVGPVALKGKTTQLELLRIMQNPV